MSVFDFGKGESGENGATIKNQGANFGSKMRITFCITRVPHTVVQSCIYMGIHMYMNSSVTHVYMYINEGVLAWDSSVGMRMYV